MMNSKSVAVGGIGYGPLAVATDGFIADNNSIVLVQNSGLDAADAIGAANVTATVSSACIFTAEEFGSDFVNVSFGTIGISSDSVLGDDFIRCTIESLPISSNEIIGVSTANVTINIAGLESVENFGRAIAVYDRQLQQIVGMASEEIFGISYITKDSIDVDIDDYTNDDAYVITRRRPRNFWTACRGSSSSASASTLKSISVIAESVGIILSACGTVRKIIENKQPIVVVGRIIESAKKEKMSSDVTVDCELLDVRKSTIIQVRSERIKKVA